MKNLIYNSSKNKVKKIYNDNIYNSSEISLSDNNDINIGYNKLVNKFSYKSIKRNQKFLITVKELNKFDENIKISNFKELKLSVEKNLDILSKNSISLNSISIDNKMEDKNKKSIIKKVEKTDISKTKSNKKNFINKNNIKFTFKTINKLKNNAFKDNNNNISKLISNKLNENIFKNNKQNMNNSYKKDLIKNTILKIKNNIKINKEKFKNEEEGNESIELSYINNRFNSYDKLNLFNKLKFHKYLKPNKPSLLNKF